jgi:chromosome segregation ATPase
MCSSADAVQCIEFLKEHKLGRCTFIPIDKLPKEVE